jgi:hypothetical protein
MSLSFLSGGSRFAKSDPTVPAMIVPGNQDALP